MLAFHRPLPQQRITHWCHEITSKNHLWGRSRDVCGCFDYCLLSLHCSRSVVFWGITYRQCQNKLEENQMLESFRWVSRVECKVKVISGWAMKYAVCGKQEKKKKKKLFDMNSCAAYRGSAKKNQHVLCEAAEELLWCSTRQRDGEDCLFHKLVCHGSRSPTGATAGGLSQATTVFLSFFVCEWIYLMLVGLCNIDHWFSSDH